MRRVFPHSKKGRLYEGYAADFSSAGEPYDGIVSKSGRPDSGRKPLVRLKKALAREKIALGEIRELVDVDGFITFWVCEVLMAHWDSYSGNRNNYYVYRDRESKRFHFIPWGADSIGLDPGPFILQEVPRSVKAVGLCAVDSGSFRRSATATAPR